MFNDKKATMKKKIIITKNAPAPIGPYNQAILINETLYVSGQIALNPITNQLITSDIVEEIEQVMNNLGAILEEANMSFSDVIKCSIFLKDMGYFGAINRIYGEYFNNDTAPVRETVQVSGLPKNVNVEISCIAQKA